MNNEDQSQFEMWTVVLVALILAACFLYRLGMIIQELKGG